MNTPTPSLPASPELPESVRWTKTPPTEQNWYWHWNGDDDCAPLPMSVLYSGTTGKCFVSSGQLSIEHAIDCDQYGGWWKPMVTPLTPTQLELAALTPLWPSADGRRPDRTPIEQAFDAMAAQRGATPSPVAGLPTPEELPEEVETALYKAADAAIGPVEELAEVLIANGWNPNTDAQWDKLRNRVFVDLTGCVRIKMRPILRDLIAQLATAKEETETAKTDAAYVLNRLRITERERDLLQSARSEALADFKNFHRSLCERFDYRHDEKDWSRDQCSLEEHIASKLTALRSDLAKANAAAEEAKRERDAETMRANCYKTEAERWQKWREEQPWLAELNSYRSQVARLVCEKVETTDELASLRAQLAAKQSVPPEARAVEAAEKLHPEFSRSWIEQLESGDNNGASPARMEEYREMFRKAQAERDRIGAIIQRTCFPPGEGEEWAHRASVEIFRLATKEAENGMMPDKSDMRKIILKHASARPTAAREDTARLDAFERMVKEGVRPGAVYDRDAGFQGWDWNGQRFPTLRAAIDAAIQQGGKTP